MACLLQGVAGILQGFLPIYPAGLGKLTKRPNSSQICSMGLQSGDLVGRSILVTLSCWRKSRTTQARWGFWRYHLGSSSYAQNTAWQMALRCFSKYPCGPHRWGISREVHEAIWHHCEKLPRHVPNHHQLRPYTPGTFAGSAHQVNNIP